MKSKSLRFNFLSILVSLLCLFGLAEGSNAATLNCDGSQSDCQAKVDTAVDGDIVNIPAGTYDWVPHIFIF